MKDQSEALEFKNLSKNFGSLQAVQNVSLRIEPGEFLCFLGPSGCGKSTLLRLLTGFEKPSSGVILHKGNEIQNLSPRHRKFGIVFQSYALFPHMNVRDNVAFGLKNQKKKDGSSWSSREIQSRVQDMLNLVGLKNWERHFPSQLSGGQQQRVAFARALAPEPSILFLDEPLSALDAKIRVHLRQVIKDLQRKLGITMIHVTHDQEEALALGDRLVVMNQGAFEQVGPPKEIYEHPHNEFVARFIGTANIVDVQLKDKQMIGPSGPMSISGLSHKNDGPYRIMVRPESLHVGAWDTQNGGAESKRSTIQLTGQAKSFTYLGALKRYQVETREWGAVTVDTPRDQSLEMDAPTQFYVHTDDLSWYSQ